MADVTPGRDRGQLLLIGGLALAVVFVSLAFLLNAAIYTETLATREPGVDADDVLEYRRATAATGTGLVRRLSVGRNASYGALVANLTTGVDAWDDATRRHRAAEGDAPSAGVVSITNGTRIVQNTTRNFTDATADPSWTLASDVTVRNYTMTVDESDLANPATDTFADLLADDAFHVNVTDGGDTYAVFVYENAAGDAAVEVFDPAGNSLGACSSPDSSVRIDLTNASVEGDHCAALTFLAGLSGYDVRYEDAHRVQGTYSLTVNEEHGALDGSHYAAFGGPGPFRSTALYAVELRVVYRGTTVYYDADVRVAPGEAGA